VIWSSVTWGVTMRVYDLYNPLGEFDHRHQINGDAC
jgi:hypothetical protein